MSEAVHDRDGWLNRLVDEEDARKVAEIRASLIAEISRDVARRCTTGDGIRSARRDRRRRDDRVHAEDPIAAKLSDGVLRGLVSELTRTGMLVVLEVSAL